MTTPAPIEHPELVTALTRLAEALDRRYEPVADASTYLEMATLAEQVSVQLHELARLFIEASRASEGSSWADVGAAFGVTRQAAMRRWSR